MKNKKVSGDDLPLLVNLMSGLLASGHYTTPGSYPNSVPELKLAVTTLDKKTIAAQGPYTVMALSHAECLLHDAKRELGIM